MQQIILQPAGNQGGRDHYADTVASPVPLERITPHVDATTTSKLREAFPGGAAAVWGVTPGGGDVNAGKWQRIAPGDIALFLKKGRADAMATVKFTTHSRSLARELWGTGDDGETWEYVYFLDEVRPVDVPYDELNKLLGYETANRFQGFNVVRPDQSAAAIARLTGQIPESVNRVWWVNQGQAYVAQRDGNLVWAPKKSNSGAVLFHWENVSRLKPRDSILHYAVGIRAVGRVTAQPRYASLPKDFPAGRWGEEGQLAEVRYRELPAPLPLTDIPQRWRDDESKENPEGPFAANGSVKQGYLFALSPRFVDRLTERFPGLLEGAVLETRELSTNQLTELSSRAATDFAEAGLQFTESDIARFAAALLAKPFVILTGLAGSGKTKLAQGFAYWIGSTPATECSCVVAVGPDWTSKDSIVGYANALDRQTYEKTSALKLILHAVDHEATPHFLILDEMNLSHVERYFADILSSMESGEPLHLHQGEAALDGVPPTLRLPANLYVIGTVNVDETTYMFSPKVLDRANVIEFQADRERMRSVLAYPRKPDLDVLAGRGSAFADIQTRRSTITPLPAAVLQQLAAETLLFFDVLAEEGLEFGYRAAFEIEEFLRYHRGLTPAWTFEQGFDAQIVQKLLPRMHGSQRKIEGALAAMSSLCYERRQWDRRADGVFLTNEASLKETAKEIARQPGRDIQRLLAADAAEAQYPLSFAKLRRMLRHLERNGFTSFAEA